MLCVENRNGQTHILTQHRGSYLLLVIVAAFCGLGGFMLGDYNFCCGFVLENIHIVIVSAKTLCEDVLWLNYTVDRQIGMRVLLGINVICLPFFFCSDFKNEIKIWYESGFMMPRIMTQSICLTLLP